MRAHLTEERRRRSFCQSGACWRIFANCSCSEKCILNSSSRQENRTRAEEPCARPRPPPRGAAPTSTTPTTPRTTSACKMTTPSYFATATRRRWALQQLYLQLARRPSWGLQWSSALAWLGFPPPGYNPGLPYRTSIRNHHVRIIASKGPENTFFKLLKINFHRTVILFLPEN